jgi:predicted ATP-grasp superfamily ATP-dependent carboligase
VGVGGPVVVVVEFVWRDEAPPSENFGNASVVISAFPSAGLATIVAAHYMIRALKLPRVGRFDSPDLSPIAVVQGGQVNPMVRAYGRPDLALVVSEFPPTPQQANALARTILDNAERHRARMIVCLEGVVPHPGGEEEEEEEEEPGAAVAPVADESPEQVWVAYSRKDPALLKAFEPSRARVLEDGVIGGVSGGLLVQGIGRSVPVAVLLVSARVAGGLPDHRAGAALIETLDRLLPEIRIDTGPLRAQAEQIEKALRAALKARPSQPMGPAAETGPSRPPEMYG